MTFMRIFLLVQAIAWLIFGMMMFLKPELSIEFLETKSMSAEGLNEIRSIYGGTSLGAAGLMFAGFFKATMQRPALFFLLAYTGGYAFARIAALPLDGFPGGLIPIFASLEILTALIAIFLLRKHRIST